MKSSLAVIVIAALLSQGSCFFRPISTAVGGTLNLAGNAVQAATNIGSKVTESAVNIGKQSIAAGNQIATSAVKDGFALGQQALDIPKQITSGIPIAGKIVQSATTSAQDILGSASNAGQNIVNTATGLGSQVLDSSNNIVQGALTIPSTVGNALQKAGSALYTGSIPQLSAAQQGIDAFRPNVGGLLTGLFGNAKQNIGALQSKVDSAVQKGVETGKQLVAKQQAALEKAVEGAKTAAQQGLENAKDKFNPSKIADAANKAVIDAKEAVGKVQADIEKVVEKAQGTVDKVVGDAQKIAEKVVTEANAAVKQALTDLPVKINEIFNNAEKIAHSVIEKIGEIQKDLRIVTYERMFSAQEQKAVDAGQKIASSAAQVVDKALASSEAAAQKLIGNVADQIQMILQQASKLVEKVQQSVNKESQTTQ